MTLSFESESPIERRVLARSLETLRKHARMDMVFGGPVHHGAAAMEITDLTGVRTRSAVNLVVRSGEGLGGKALMLGRPVSVARYFSSEGITHVYDHAVRPEAIETLAALPIVVDRVPRILVYLATRTQVAWVIAGTTASPHSSGGSNATSRSKTKSAAGSRS